MASASEPPEVIVKNRFLGFLIWQCIPSTAIFFLFKSFILSSLASTARNKIPFLPSFVGVFSFLSFHLSQLLFSISLSVISSPRPHRPASPLELVLGIFRLLLVPSGESQPPSDFQRRAKVSLGFVLFVAAACVSGLVSVVSICSLSEDSGVMLRIGVRSLAIGLVYGLFYLYKRRWVLEFPIIQRPPFFSFKMGLPLAIKRAFKLSIAAYISSVVLLVVLPHHLQNRMTLGKFVVEQIRFYIGSFAVFLCWELNHHLHQVLHTKRLIFAPPKGSAAAETNPSEPLLAALEDCAESSLIQYLAYLDLCMVCENNVDSWRRAAFFEETGETYKRVIGVCLRPLKELASKLAEGLESCSSEKAYQLSTQLQSPVDSRVDSKYSEPLNDYQLYAWCARTVASLTAHSHTEDRYGVAQLSGSNAAVISVLLSCLLAVEAFMGKKTSLQSPNHLTGVAGIRWATQSSGRREIVVNKKRDGRLHSNAYAMADALRTSIYCVVSVFHEEMLTSAKGSNIGKDWIISSKPPFGTRELLVQKLLLFLDFRAS
ncbi:hypothetical protein HS088_TW20G00622 [Tripterygium wilfordii]|uniref:Nucleoporin protein Ndc1-Nup n=1 Tax=Tripterygium wilfordii TaxID=458696 RepID=A0A7J7C7Y3_TRIWF|nr:uncharacterized protein LOC119986424 [Tripterygium wilfordii]KAF5730249.1 hypothetical protein HS088_TW20G00622 [Tripterygium wilfordii]